MGLRRRRRVLLALVTYRFVRADHRTRPTAARCGRCATTTSSPTRSARTCASLRTSSLVIGGAIAGLSGGDPGRLHQPLGPAGLGLCRDRRALRGGDHRRPGQPPRRDARRDPRAARLRGGDALHPAVPNDPGPRAGPAVGRDRAADPRVPVVSPAGHPARAPRRSPRRAATPLRARSPSRRAPAPGRRPAARSRRPPPAPRANPRRRERDRRRGRSSAARAWRELRRRARGRRRLDVRSARHADRASSGPTAPASRRCWRCSPARCRPTAGQILYRGEDITALPAYRRARLGLVRTFQLASEFKRLTVIENLLSAVPGQRGDTFRGALLGRRYWGGDRSAAIERAQAMLEQLRPRAARRPLRRRPQRRPAAAGRDHARADGRARRAAARRADGRACTRGWPTRSACSSSRCARRA